LYRKQSLDQFARKKHPQGQCSNPPAIFTVKEMAFGKNSKSATPQPTPTPGTTEKTGEKGKKGISSLIHILQKPRAEWEKGKDKKQKYPGRLLPYPSLFFSSNVKDQKGKKKHKDKKGIRLGGKGEPR
jgi:hypothetical protein